MKFLSFGSRTYIMGILNITPDSFSGDGLLNTSDLLQAARRQALEFVSAGADILDIGGESTRPGAQPVSMDEEMSRVLPVIEMLAGLELDVILSVDTYKSEVAEAALRAGAHWINDVWGLRADPRMAEVAARFKTGLILMHNRSKPSNAQLQERLGGRYVGMEYDNLIEDIRRELLESVHLARQGGVADEQIILDPGIGFGKTVEQNLEILRRLDEFKQLGFPLLLGVSRKSFIGYTLNLPPDQRLEGTLTACVIGIQRGADILRVHDVQPIVRAARMADAILR
ncbi:MAG: dihydropteroate synthase [Chloroflexota bacterium]